MNSMDQVPVYRTFLLAPYAVPFVDSYLPMRVRVFFVYCSYEYCILEY